MDDVREIVRDYAERAEVRDGALARLTALRRRRARTRKAAGIAAALLLAGGALTWTFAGLGRLDPPTPAESPTPLTTRDPLLETAVVQGISITYPRDWWLVELAGEVTDQDLPRWPSLQLTNYPVELDASRLCPANHDSMPPDGVLLYVEQIKHPVMATALGPKDRTDMHVIDGSCGRGSYATWSEGASSLTALVDAGPGASERDRRMLDAAFRSLTTDRQPLWHINAAIDAHTRPPFAESEAAQAAAERFLALASSPKLVLGSGERPTPWTLRAAPDPSGSSPVVVANISHANTVELPMLSAGSEIALQSWARRDGRIQAVFGTASLDVDRIMIRADSRLYDAKLLPLPPELHVTYQGFVVEGIDPPASGGTIVAVDAAGGIEMRTLGENVLDYERDRLQDFAEPVGEPVVLVHGPNEPSDWTLTYQSTTRGPFIMLEERRGAGIGGLVGDTLDHCDLYAGGELAPGSDGRSSILVMGIASTRVIAVEARLYDGQVIPMELVPLPGTDMQAFAAEIPRTFRTVQFLGVDSSGARVSGTDTCFPDE